MNMQKDLQSIFRERQHLLDENPSPQAWRRLERRLDIHARRHHRAGLRRNMAMAAGIFALVVFIGLMGLHFGGEQLRLSALNDSGDFRLETVSLDDADTGAIQIQEYNRAYSSRQSSIQEGQPGKELLVKSAE